MNVAPITTRPSGAPAIEPARSRCPARTTVSPVPRIVNARVYREVTTRDPAPCRVLGRRRRARTPARADVDEAYDLSGPMIGLDVDLLL